MNSSLFKEVIQLFKFIQDLFLNAQKLITPPKAFSWQTFIYLSAFSWGASYLATGIIKGIIALCGWLFLVAGTAWYTTDDPVRVPGTFMPVGALITGFLVGVFAFGHQDNIITARTIVIWPTLAAIITGIPEFFTGGGALAKTTIPKIEVRKKIIILLAWSMLISCWIQFYFVIDKWLTEYPSLSAETFENSTFVIKIEPKSKQPQNGNIILNKIQPKIEERIANRAWSEVERWLLEANQNVGNLGDNLIAENLNEYEEKALWRVEPRITNIPSGYQLDILGIWQGPSDNPRGFFLKKTCLIQVKKNENDQSVGDINCDRQIRFYLGSPPPKR